MKSTKYTDNDLKNAVLCSRSIAQVLEKIGLVPAGGNYSSIKKKIKDLNLDISHFTAQAWRKGLEIGPKRDIEVYLSNKYPIKSSRLKRRLISEGLFEKKCYSCELEVWLDKEIPLELHHINGNSEDNALSNLMLLCPNCHALTDTYRGKNIGSSIT